MESFETEVCTEIEKRDGRGRRLLGRDYWIGLLDAFERSDLTQKAFCQSEGVNYHTFVNWRARLKCGEQNRAPVRFQQLSIESAPSQAPESLEVTLPCGTALRGSSATSIPSTLRIEAQRGKSDTHGFRLSVVHKGN